MKYYETHYEDYLSSLEKYNIHPELSPFMDSLPKNITELENIIIYGASGVGKYTQVLNIIKKYSPSELKYDKKITAQTEKQEYNYRISDIHYEIDMSLLGCNSKLLWNEIFLQIVDIISVKPEKTGIILCKNFHLIHTELLEIFYSYMQQYNNSYSNIKIKFFILTEQLSFLPTTIINSCHILRVQRPNKDKYNRIYGDISEKAKKNMVEAEESNSELKGEKQEVINVFENIDSENILNIKEIRSFPYIKTNNDIPKDVFNTVCDNIIEDMLSPKKIEFTVFRDTLYDILTYNLDMNECLWYILKYFVEGGHLKQGDISDILVRSYTFLKYYNNNYRPIYHLESIIFYIINKLFSYNEL
jgi:Cdc6-like AAA superfamily ATPase